MKSEMCKKCIHTNVCFKDKNVCGDVFVPGNPMIFDNNELYRKYEERKKQEFPCNDYFPIVVKCKDCRHWVETQIEDEITGEKERTCNLLYTEWGDENGYCYLGEKVTK